MAPTNALGKTTQNATPAAVYGSYQYGMASAFAGYGASTRYAGVTPFASFGPGNSYTPSSGVANADFQRTVQESYRVNAAAAEYAEDFAKGQSITLRFNDSDSTDTFDFGNEDHHMKKLRKAVVYAAMVAIMTTIGTHSQLAVASNASTTSLINLATANAKDLCGQINYSGSDVSGSIKLAADAKLPLMLKKLGISAHADAQASVQASGDHYSGPARKDLPTVISSELQCRADAERYLLDAMKQEINTSAQAPNQTTRVSVKTGDVIQNQSQQVNVNNTPVDIPSFTIQEQPFSSAFEVTPHSSVKPQSDMPTQPDAPTPNNEPSQTNFSLQCDDSGEIKPGSKASFELIEDLPRCVQIGAGIMFVGERSDHGHKRAILQSTRLWDSWNTVKAADNSKTYLYAYALAEKGEAIYIYSNGIAYSLSAEESREPSDGSEMRVTITISRAAKANSGI